MNSQKHISDLFEQEPEKWGKWGWWGLRGDPYLWRELRNHFADVPLPESARILEEEIEKAFELLTGHALSEDTNFYVERLAHGGMSSGHVCTEFWREQALPLLKDRFADAMITLQYKLKPEDYIKAQYLHIRPSPRLKYLGIALLSLWLVALVTSAFLPSFPSFSRAVGIFTPALFFGLFYVLILLVFLSWNSRRIFSQQQTLQADYKTVISPEMIETISEYGTMRMRLSDFHKYKVGKDLILLYHSQALFHMFPRRFFASEEDFKTFLSYLEANLGNSKRYL